MLTNTQSKAATQAVNRRLAHDREPSSVAAFGCERSPVMSAALSIHEAAARAAESSVVLLASKQQATQRSQKNAARFELVEGNRINPGRVLATFSAAETYKCGGPATACLRAYDRMMRSGTVAEAFFRKVQP